jgi:hypothetical protein
LLVEDDLIEFKRTWIKPHKAARRIAAHANAARGQDILWLIGVDPAGDLVTVGGGTGKNGYLEAYRSR